MTRNWRHLEAYLDRLAGEVLSEPATPAHTAFTRKSFGRFVLPHQDRVKLALDVGCGPGTALELFRQHGIPAIGITLSEDDVQACRAKGFEVVKGDQSFLDFPERHFDLVWSRHCLEHSAMPLLTLLEYNRVLKDDGFLYVEVPQPDSIHIDTPNHYSLFSDRGWRSLFMRADLKVADYTLYSVVRRWDWDVKAVPAGHINMMDYYYAYWLTKKRHVFAAGS